MNEEKIVKQLKTRKSTNRVQQQVVEVEYSELHIYV